MRIFLTGPTGYVGAAVLDALVRAGYDVTALVRDNEKARRVTKRGARPVIGNLAEPTRSVAPPMRRTVTCTRRSKAPRAKARP